MKRKSQRSDKRIFPKTSFGRIWGRSGNREDGGPSLTSKGVFALGSIGPPAAMVNGRTCQEELLLDGLESVCPLVRTSAFHPYPASPRSDRPQLATRTVISVQKVPSFPDDGRRCGHEGQAAFVENPIRLFTKIAWVGGARCPSFLGAGGAEEV